MTSELLISDRISESSCSIASCSIASCSIASSVELSSTDLSSAGLSVSASSQVQVTVEPMFQVEVPMLSDRVIELTRSLYKTDHQIEFMHLTEEAAALLQQLQTVKQQRLAIANSASN